MSEEIEKKLTELLGLKKQLEEITSAKKKSEMSSDFEKKTRKTKLIFYVYLAVSILILLAGVSALESKTGNQFFALFMAIVGFESTVLIKMWYHVVNTKLAILQEMKQFELRMLEALKCENENSRT